MTPEEKGEGIYVCPVCKLKFPNSEWRQKDPERRTCQNGHKKVNMIWYPSLTEYMYQTNKGKMSKW